MPPFYDAKPFEAAIRQGNDKFSFTADNEVLYFRDKMGSDWCVICNCLHLVHAPELILQPAPTVWTSDKLLTLR